MSQTNAPARGSARERSLTRDIYFSDSYFELKQLFSLAHQIEKIHKLRPSSILEVGIGNGFTSSYLRRAGYDVVTADINPALEPDICAPLDELEAHLDGRRFDLVVCCEVLEHMPFEKFPGNLSILKAVGDRLFMTLPNHRKYFGFGGLVRLPKRKAIEINFQLPIRLGKILPMEHFWEVGHDPKTDLKSIVNELQYLYENVNTGTFTTNPYHRYFIAT
jgi:SAM-dependent methyltransferase